MDKYVLQRFKDECPDVYKQWIEEYKTVNIGCQFRENITAEPCGADCKSYKYCYKHNKVMKERYNKK